VRGDECQRRREAGGEEEREERGRGQEVEDETGRGCVNRWETGWIGWTDRGLDKHLPGRAEMILTREDMSVYVSAAEPISAQRVSAESMMTFSGPADAAGEVNSCRRTRPD